MVLQSWLYSVPADKMPLRSFVTALLAGGFLTLWCWIDTKNPGRYDTLFSFSSYDTEDFDMVDAVKKVGEEEKTIRYTRRSVGTKMVYMNDQNQPFRKADAEGAIFALIVTEKDKPVRFITKLDKNGNFPPGEIQYREEGGKRYIDDTMIGRVNRPGTLKVIYVLLLNFGHFLIWTLSLWLVMNYALGHAISIACCLWLVITLLIMPVLFTKTRKQEKVITPQVSFPSVNDPNLSEPEPKDEEKKGTRQFQDSNGNGIAILWIGSAISSS
jgi:hypothetical protein